MISPVDAATLTTAQRSAVIYGKAQAELATRLWRAALGGDAAGDEGAAAPTTLRAPSTFEDELFGLLAPRPAIERPAEAARPDPSPLPAAVAPPPLPAALPALGANARYGPALAAAAARTGLPPAALTAIVNAEAATGPDGSWRTYSRNPRSSAAGLGQFLSGTWVGMATTAGTWLNGVARSNGWLSPSGSVLPAARSALLALRYDGEASISTIADYARQNLDAFKRAGIAIGDSAEGVARLAYIGHHLGLGDGIRFLKGGLDPQRAHRLLNAQIGAARAGERIEGAGNAAAAHRNWLLDFIGRRLSTGLSD